MNPSYGMVMLMDNEMVTVVITVPFVQCLEILNRETWVHLFCISRCFGQVF